MINVERLDEEYSQIPEKVKDLAFLQMVNELELIRKIFQNQKKDINRTLKIMEDGFNQATTARQQKPRKKATKPKKRHTSSSG